MNVFPATYDELKIEIRYRCSADRHPGCTYNNWADKTWCRCGAVVRQGNCAEWPSRYERAEWDSVRPDRVGIEAREFLARYYSNLELH